MCSRGKLLHNLWSHTTTFAAAKLLHTKIHTHADSHKHTQHFTTFFLAPFLCSQCVYINKTDFPQQRLLMGLDFPKYLQYLQRSMSYIYSRCILFAFRKANRTWNQNNVRSFCGRHVGPTSRIVLPESSHAMLLHLFTFPSPFLGFA